MSSKGGEVSVSDSERGGGDPAAAAVLPAPAEGRGGNMSSRKGAYNSASNLATLNPLPAVFHIKGGGSYGRT